MLANKRLQFFRKMEIQTDRGQNNIPQQNVFGEGHSWYHGYDPHLYLKGKFVAEPIKFALIFGRENVIMTCRRQNDYYIPH